MMAQLHQRCGSIHKQLLCFESGSHNETWTCPGYYHAINTFIHDLRSRESVTQPVSSTSHQSPLLPPPLHPAKSPSRPPQGKQN
jgi:hypothetical protein